MPATGAMVELLIGGTWTDYTERVYLRDRIRISRGRRDQGARVDAGSCAFTLNNKDGLFSPRNPESPLYGLIGRNTPVRVSAVGGDPWLGAYAALTPAHQASTPDATPLHVTGDLDVRVDLQPEDWNSSTQTQLVGRYDTAANRSWRVLLISGTVYLQWSADGTTVLGNSVPLGTTTLTARTCLRATLDVNNGASGKTVRFYTGPTLDGPWTQLGTDQTSTGTTSVFAGTAPLIVGDGAPSASVRLYGVQVRNGIGGTVVASADFTAQDVGATAFTDAAGRAWTVTSGGLTNRHTRFLGEINSWPSRWDVSGGDVYVPVQAAGILRRLGQGSTAVASALRRAIVDANPLVYWPLEDGSTATQAASGLLGGTPMSTTAGAPSFGATGGPFGSLPLPSFANGGRLHALVTGGVNASWTVDCIVQFPTSLPLGFAAAIGWTATGSRATAWELDAQPVGDGGLSVQWANGDFSDFGGPYYSNTNVLDGRWHHVRVTVAQSGSAISIQAWLDGTRVINASEASVTLGAITSVDVNGGQANDAGVPSLGHLAIWSPSTTTNTYVAVNGSAGETTTDRISGVCGSAGVPVVWPYGSGGTSQVGPQTVDALLALVESAAGVDMGVLYEARDSIALAYRPRVSLYNQTPALTLDYATRGEVAPPLEPTEDDTGLTNDVTVSRAQGSSARVVLDTGPLSVATPPDGVGAYPTSATVAAYTDTQLADLAAWLLHLGTWDEARYPSVTVNLAAGPWLTSDACTVDTGDLITIANPPPWLPPGDIILMCQGYSETIGVYDWEITYNCTPGGPWQVGVLDDPVLGRADTDGSSLAAGVSASATTLSVAVTAGPLWVTTAANPAEFPFDIRVGGEVMTVTGITGASSPQTFTVLRSVNGIVKAQTTSTDVRLATPMTLAL